MKNTINIILFDLGGVLIEPGESPFPKHWLSDSNGYSSEQWFPSDAAIDFERGKLTPIEFAETIKQALSLNATISEILTEFTRWPIGLYPGAATLLTKLKQNHTLAVLSNTNELHWPRIINEFQMPLYCEYIYSSHLLQVAKPEPEVFTIVLDKLGAKAGSVLFFDDKAENIKAAQELGINSHQVKGIDQLRQKLEALKLI